MRGEYTLDWKYGNCESCNSELLPAWFTQEEVMNGYKTGRTRQAVDFLVCPVCLKKYIVDDSFDKPWE